MQIWWVAALSYSVVIHDLMIVLVPSTFQLNSIALWIYTNDYEENSSGAQFASSWHANAILRKENSDDWTVEWSVFTNAHHYHHLFIDWTDLTKELDVSLHSPGNIPILHHFPKHLSNHSLSNAFLKSMNSIVIQDQVFVHKVLHMVDSKWNGL